MGKHKCINPVLMATMLLLGLLVSLTGLYQQAQAKQATSLNTVKKMTSLVPSLVGSLEFTPTDISLSSSTVPEHEPGGTLVGTFSTADSDNPDETHTYSLVSGDGSDDNVSFAISPGSNELRTAVSFDHQAKSSYSIRVRSTGTDGFFLEKSFIITITAVPPNLRLTKTAKPTSVLETGGNVTFTIRVNNIGQENFTLNSFSDNKFNLATRCPNAVGTVITPGNRYTCIFTEFISGDFGGSAHRNTARAVVEDNENQTQEDTDNSTVNFADVTPNLSLAYTPDPSEVNEPGGSVTFSILVTNLSPEMGTLTLLQDSTFGNLNGQGSCAINGTIGPNGGTYSCSFSRFVSGSEGTNPVYTSTAQLADDDGNTKDVSDNAVVTIDERLPGSERLIVYLPLITKPTPTDLFIKNDTGGAVNFAVVGTGVSCRVPAGQQNFFCGSFPPGTYSVQVSSICGNLTTTKTYGSGPQSTRVSCK